MTDYTITLDGDEVAVTDFGYTVEPIGSEQYSPHIGVESPPAAGVLKYTGENATVKRCLNHFLSEGRSATPFTLTIGSKHGGLEASVFLDNRKFEILDGGDVLTTVEWFALDAEFTEPPTDGF